MSSATDDEEIPPTVVRAAAAPIVAIEVEGSYVKSYLDDDEAKKIIKERTPFQMSSAFKLADMWIRHQYLKVVFPFVVFGFLVVEMFNTYNYLGAVDDHIARTLSSFNCTTMSSRTLTVGLFSSSPSFVCNLNVYYRTLPSLGGAHDLTDYYRYSEVHVACSKNDKVDFSFGLSPTDFAAQNSTIRTIFSVVSSFFFTYFVYEFLVLAFFDCLAFWPALDERTAEPFLEYGSIYRIGFFLFDQCCYYNDSSNAKVKQRGMRMNLYYAMIIILPLSLGLYFLPQKQDCVISGESRQTFVAVVWIEPLFYLALVVYLQRKHIWTLWRAGSMEILSPKYSNEFLVRRFRRLSMCRERNVLDILAGPCAFVYLYLLLFVLIPFVLLAALFGYCFCPQLYRRLTVQNDDKSPFFLVTSFVNAFLPSVFMRPAQELPPRGTRLTRDDQESLLLLDRQAEEEISGLENAVQMSPLILPV